MNSESRGPKPQPQPELPMTDVISSKDLIKNGRELVILHEGQAYRLRITKQNRLILTK